MIVKKGDLIIQYEVVIKKIKHTYFHFKQDKIIVSKNKYISNEKIEAYLLSHFDRFYSRLSKQVNLPTYFGEHLDIKMVNHPKFHYEIGNEIIIYHPESMSNEQAVNAFYKQELTKKVESLKPWLEEKLQPLGLTCLPTKIKKLKTKYGSCHTKKLEITLNQFLAKLDLIYLKYVLLHEYAHVLVPNHQKPFYEVLDKLMPGHKDIQKALKKHHL